MTICLDSEPPPTNLRSAASLFMMEDGRVARLLAEEKVAFQCAAPKAIALHFDIIRANRASNGIGSALHLDLLRDTKLVNSPMVAAAAYPVLDHSGELLPTRLTAPAERIPAAAIFPGSGLADHPQYRTTALT